MNYLKLAVIGLGWFLALVLALATAHARNAQAEAAASEETPVFAAQSDARLNNREIRQRIYRIEDQLILQKNAQSLTDGSIARVEDSVAELGLELDSVRLQLKVAASNAESANAGLSAQIDELNKALKDLSVTFQSTAFDVNEKLSRLDSVDVAVQGEVMSLQGTLGRQLTDVRSELDRSSSEFSNRFENVDLQVTGVGEDVSMQRLFGASGALILLALLFLLALKMRSGRQALFGRLADTSEELRKEHLNLDLKLASLLEREMDAASSSTDRDKASSTEADHSLPLQVAAEIHRMEKRLSVFPDDVKGVKPLVKALERLNEGLLEKDYEIVDLVGTKYVEGMTVQPTFVLDDSLEVGEQTITKVIKPQVNYKNKIIEIAQVEVSTGGMQ